MTTVEVRVYRDLLAADAEWAQRTRAALDRDETVMVNMIGAPGCGKTCLIERTAATAAGRCRIAVLEGDVETTRDADRLARAGVAVSQLITQGACHLPASLVHQALRDLALAEFDVVVVENVGNLVCPAHFDVGEHAKIAVLSVAEGEDKPIKYPHLFQEARAVVLTKIDLLPHLSVDLDAYLGFLREVNGTAPVFPVSATTGAGIEDWVNWLLQLQHSA